MGVSRELSWASTLRSGPTQTPKTRLGEHLSAPTESPTSLRQPTGMGWLGFDCSKVIITPRWASTQAPGTSLGDRTCAPTESGIARADRIRLFVPSSALELSPLHPKLDQLDSVSLSLMEMLDSHHPIAT